MFLIFPEFSVVVKVFVEFEFILCVEDDVVVYYFDFHVKGQ